MNTLTKLSALPLELCSKALESYRAPGEPVVCLQIPSIGNFTPFRMRGRTNRTYRFEWDRTALCHVLRVPASVWMMENHALAKDVFSQIMLRPVVPVLEGVADGLGGDGAAVVVAEKPEARGQKPDSNSVNSEVRKQKTVTRKKATAA